MLQKLRINPFGTSLLVFAIYFVWFLIGPRLLSVFDSGQAPTNQLEELVAQLPNQIALIIILTGIVAILKWWQPVGFTRQEKKSLRFMWPPLLFTFIFFGMGLMYSSKSGAGFLGSDSTS